MEPFKQVLKRIANGILTTSQGVITPKMLPWGKMGASKREDRGKLGSSKREARENKGGPEKEDRARNSNVQFARNSNL